MEESNSLLKSHREREREREREIESKFLGVLLYSAIVSKMAAETGIDYMIKQLVETKVSL